MLPAQRKGLEDEPHQHPLSLQERKQWRCAPTPEETAARLGLTNPDTLAVWRCTKRYPLPWVKIGSRVRYRASDVEVFIAANLHGTTV